MPLTPVTPWPSPTPRCHFLCRGCVPGPSPPVVSILMLCSPLSFSPPVLLPPRRAGKAGWWCYPWFWDSQSKMTLPISPICNPLGRSRSSRTLRGTRGRRKEEGSPAGGRDAGWRRRRRRRPASRSAQVGATRQRARRRLQLSPLERQRRAHPDPFLPILPSFPPSIPIPITDGRMLGGFRAPCQERMHCWGKRIPKMLHHTRVHTRDGSVGAVPSLWGFFWGHLKLPGGTRSPHVGGTATLEEGGCASRHDRHVKAVAPLSPTSYFYPACFGFAPCFSKFPSAAVT